MTKQEKDIKFGFMWSVIMGIFAVAFLMQSASLVMADFPSSESQFYAAITICGFGLCLLVLSKFCWDWHRVAKGTRKSRSEIRLEKLCQQYHEARNRIVDGKWTPRQLRAYVACCDSLIATIVMAEWLTGDDEETSQ